MEQTMKTLLCCIVKMENLYLRDFIQYYKNIGFDKVVMYDNNDETGEYPQQVIGDFISDGYVIYKNARGKYRYQLEAYTECYKEYKHDYDWIAFFDVDEYLEIVEGVDIKTYLSKEKFADACAIPFYWMVYGDCGKLHYENKPVYDRFPIPIGNPYENDRNTFKFMVRGLDEIELFFTDANAISYTIYGRNTFPIINTAGESLEPLYVYQGYTYDEAYLKHYQTLTIDEFLCRRFGRRSYADNATTFSIKRIMGIFTEICEMTPEKEKIIDEFFKNYEEKIDISPDDAEDILANSGSGEE